MKVFLTYDYFTPAYKAGGPIQSCTNLVNLLGSAIDVYVFTTAYDIDGTPLDVEVDKWLQLPSGAQVFYKSHKQEGRQVLFKELNKIKPGTIYVQGLFSLLCTIYPLLWSLVHKPKVVIAPRGMLQKSALGIKPLKKKVFLAGLRPLVKYLNVIWHATNTSEERDVVSNIGPSVLKYNVSNVPRLPEKALNKTMKRKGELKLVSVSLIALMKNHLFLLDVLALLPSGIKVTYAIYGPIKDAAFFEAITQKMKTLPQNVEVHYKGSIEPQFVFEKTANYDLFVLPTLGENFGHAIFEAFGNGLPVLISDKTPWHHLGEAGADLPLATKLWVDALIGFAKEDEVSWSMRQKSSRKLAEEFLSNCNFKEDYLKMFKGV